LPRYTRNSGNGYTEDGKNNLFKIQPEIIEGRGVAHGWHPAKFEPEKIDADHTQPENWQGDSNIGKEGDDGIKDSTPPDSTDSTRGYTNNSGYDESGYSQMNRDRQAISHHFYHRFMINYGGPEITTNGIK
jgi:hypothetical protein